jgi:hypothetical protein
MAARERSDADQKACRALASEGAFHGNRRVYPVARISPWVGSERRGTDLGGNQAVCCELIFAVCANFTIESSCA